MVTVNGYHGTDAAHTKAITTTGFKASENENEWLGHGIYFFIDGLMDPHLAAKRWAIFRSHNKRRYSCFAVLNADVSSEKCLDLRKTDHLRRFYDYRERLIKKHDLHFTRGGRGSFNVNDCIVFNELKKAFQGLDMIIAPLAIKSVGSDPSLGSIIPNCVVMCAGISAMITGIRSAEEGMI